MKIFFYALRPYDELPYVEQFSKETGIKYGWTADYPNKDNMELCRGSDVFSCIPCDMSAHVIDKLADLGIKWIACRSIGYNHVDLEECRKKGIRVSNVAYPPESVADYAIMCLLMVSLGIIGLVCSATAQYFAAKAAVGFSTKLRLALFSHIQGLSFTEMDTMGTSTLITRMTSDINQVQNGVNMVLRLFLRSPCIVFGAMIMAFTIDVKAALIFVVTIPLLSVVVFGIMLITIPPIKITCCYLIYSGTGTSLSILTVTFVPHPSLL